MAGTPEVTFSMYMSGQTRAGFDPRPEGWGLAGSLYNEFEDRTAGYTYLFSELRGITDSPYPERMEVTVTTLPDGRRQFLGHGPFVDIGDDRIVLPGAPEHRPVFEPVTHTDDQYLAHRIVTSAVRTMREAR